jgi:hypothetical protein
MAAADLKSFSIGSFYKEIPVPTYVRYITGYQRSIRPFVR